MSVAMFILVLSIITVMFFSSRNSLSEDVKNQAHILGESLAPAILFNDIKTAKALFAALPPYIEYVTVLDQYGIEFISYTQNTVASNTDITSTLERYFSEVYIDYPIVLNNREVGLIQISASLDKIYGQLAKFLLFTLFSLLLSSTLGILMLRHLQTYLISPIVGLTKSMRLISSTDNYSLRFHLDNKDELGELASGFNTMLNKIQSHQVKLDAELVRRREAEDRLQQLAFYDNVTHLPNRHFFKERLENVVISTLRHNTSCCVILIDLDDFKNVNDTLGHHVGDELLKAVAERLGKELRGSDALCRIGGDEFAMILDHTDDISQVEYIANRMIKLLSQPFMLQGQEVFIGASIGASFCPADASDIPTLLRNADNAMYSAKNRGKNHFLMYKPDMDHKSMKRFTLENALRRALELKEIFLLYQPLIQIGTNKIVGFEVLVRWNNPELGIVQPADFIPIAEETGLIIPIGEHVFYEACLQGKHWRENFGFEGTISVNLSGRQLLKHDIVERIVEIAQTAEWPYHLLNLELTESILMDHSKETFDKLEALNNLGFSISIDDFGTGYSSMSYLKRYPINTLKIDRSFISDLPYDTNDVAISKAIIALGQSLSMKIVAEGVETREQLDFLKKHGCNFAQGFFYSKPMSPEQVEDFISARHELCIEKG
ncbi:MAG: EAL domain-containing protein [Nitrosomonas sp.]|nr:EAL domain-containing protein [Nitrosomonas sp.]